MSTDLLLLPQPQRLTLTGGTLPLGDDRLIALVAPDAQPLRRTATLLQEALATHAGSTWEIVAGSAAPDAQIGARLAISPGATAHPEGYELTVSDAGINVVGSTAAGVHYGVLTLTQIIAQRDGALPHLRCTDWPDFPNRGVMLDVSRNKVPSMATLYALIERLAGWKINQIQLYTEHTFAFRRHPKAWADESPITGEEILALDAFCREHFIELVPNQNTFGHLHHWLDLPEYTHLAESPEGADTPWGFYRPGPFSISPAVPESMDLVRDMLDELLPHFSSGQVNIGGDETYDVGQGRSKALVEERGKAQVYLDFMLKIHREVRARGKTMQLWGDIIMEHPELAPKLPRDVIALEWGYDAAHPFDEHGAAFAASGVPFYLCPGTSTWNTIGGRTENAVLNLQRAAVNGRKHGAIGYLITDWGDNGHWQPLAVSYLGLAYGAGLAWAVDANGEMDIPAVLDRYAFQDRAGVMGQLAYDLGNVYLQGKPRIHNSTILFWILQLRPDELLARREDYGVDDLRGDLDAMEAEIDRVMADLDRADMACADADLIKAEYAWAGAMLRHACRRGRWLESQDPAEAAALADDLDELLATFDMLWHARNREAAFRRSRALMAAMYADYGRVRE
ncbi:MAG: family 20 glycosylhydrolase [Caldilineaceae bacterium]|nr:family 20 glycosylhydrolase [Caldilineaceae bacterium]